MQERGDLSDTTRTIQEDQPACQKAHCGFVSLKDERVNVHALRYLALDWRAKTPKSEHSANGGSPTASITSIRHDDNNRIVCL
jgi:hypothetical protein